MGEQTDSGYKIQKQVNLAMGVSPHNPVPTPRVDCEIEQHRGVPSIAQHWVVCEVQIWVIFGFINL